MVTTTTIKLDNLLLSTENFRYETLNNQKEAITRMLEEQRAKLVNLAQHILKNITPCLKGYTALSWRRGRDLNPRPRFPRVSA